MYRARLSFAAEGIVIDRDTNAVSAYNILDRLTAEGFPVLLQKTAFFVLWERAAEDPAQVPGHFFLELSGRRLHEQPVEIDFQTVLRNQLTLRMHGLVLPQPGILTFRVTLEPGAVGEYSVDVAATEGAVRADVVQQPANPI